MHPRGQRPYSYIDSTCLTGWRLSIAQCLSHFVATSIVALLVANSFVEDFVNLLRLDTWQRSPLSADLLEPVGQAKLADSESPDDSRTLPRRVSQKNLRRKRSRLSLDERAGLSQPSAAGSQPDTRRATPDPHYYIQEQGFHSSQYWAETEDGFLLSIQRIVAARRRSRSYKGTVLLMHGLFQSSGVYITNQSDSLAFYLAREGYDVWLGNNRCVEKRHRTLTPSDVGFWDWSLEDLARYDFPCLVKFVVNHSGADTITYIGHSQGNAQAFLGLALSPEVAKHLKCFIALAPAVYIGSLLQQGPMALLTNCPSRLFRRIFGIKQFLPIMDVVQNYVHAPAFAAVAYHMFHYLFHWSDRNWPKGGNHKPIYFQFTPRPCSSKSILHWGQISRAGVLQPFIPVVEDSTVITKSVHQIQVKPSPSEDRASATARSGSTGHHKTDSKISIDSFDDDDSGVPSSLSGAKAWDFSTIHCPLAIFYGTKDKIVDGERLSIDAIQDALDSGRIRKTFRLEGMEHMDPIWAVDAKTRVFAKCIKFIESL
ncbi:Alpha/Beta hydrolase protein [Polychytrium aggregatum]|uniref:Alpha/Beta hydrolase protein n=1 Tax=Polychytrium aggregatum TaxID=110093 RepID=UPI0022FDF8B4|nr:Alpha/Beta hydrolase protein [Polychytrium aggregatum]KAI9199859.1 Alpha/Beta hydrolase protein [Polychytrium aggregatum]